MPNLDFLMLKLLTGLVEIPGFGFLDLFFLGVVKLNMDFSARLMLYLASCDILSLGDCNP